MHEPVADGADAATFIAKWRGAWPEWSLVEGFLPAAQRPVADAWQALQFEWQEAAWAGADSRPGEAKLAWWAEELDGWSHGRRRHPLGAVLLPRPAPWRDIASVLPAMAVLRAQPSSAGAAWEALEPATAGIASVEAALFGGPTAPRAIAACWLHARLARHHTDAVPRALASPDDASPRPWIDALLASWPAQGQMVESRSIALALARRRLERGNAAAPLSPWSALWTGWRAARR
jgi:hypothetical protein